MIVAFTFHWGFHWSWPFILPKTTPQNAKMPRVLKAPYFGCPNSPLVPEIPDRFQVSPGFGGLVSASASWLKQYVHQLNFEPLKKWVHHPPWNWHDSGKSTVWISYWTWKFSSDRHFLVFCGVWFFEGSLKNGHPTWSYGILRKEIHSPKLTARTWK